MNKNATILLYTLGVLIVGYILVHFAIEHGKAIATKGTAAAAPKAAVPPGNTLHTATAPAALTSQPLAHTVNLLQRS